MCIYTVKTKQLGKKSLLTNDICHVTFPERNTTQSFKLKARLHWIPWWVHPVLPFTLVSVPQWYTENMRQHTPAVYSRVTVDRNHFVLFHSPSPLPLGHPRRIEREHHDGMHRE